MDIDISGYPQILFVLIENKILSWIVVELAIRIFITESREIENWLIIDQGCYCVLMKDITKYKVQEFLYQLDAMIQDKFPYAKAMFSVYGVIAEMHGSIRQFLKLIKEREKWEDEHFIEPEKKILNSPVSCLFQFEEKSRRSLENQLHESSSTDVMQNIVLWEKKNRIQPEELKNFLVEYLRRRCETSMLDSDSAILNRISKSRDITELSSVLLSIYQQEENGGERFEIRKARKRIEEKYASDLSLVNVSQQVNLSPQYFSRLFSETVGINFGDYLLDVRMKRAQYLILNSDKKIYEIAEDVGIHNYRYFTSLFKKYYGVTPKVYKNRGLRQ